MNKRDMTKIVNWVWFDLEGNEWKLAGHAPAPIGLLLQDTVGHYKGWYFFDEMQEQHGPFSSFEEAVELFKQYGESL